MNSKFKILVGLLATAATLVALSPGGVDAKGAANVRNTLHNLSSDSGVAWDDSDSQYKTNEVEVCVFCHTPHGGSLTGPLWNHNLPTNTFTHYDSVTLGSYLSGLLASRPVSDESMLCMGCHDGSIAVTHLINVPNNTPSAITPVAEIVGIFGGPGARIGGSYADPFDDHDLTDDHPISFSYDLVRNGPEYTSGPKLGQLHTTADAVTAGVRFFNRTSVTPGTNRVECSTCHDPHVFYHNSAPDYRPFLIMKNDGSKLCLACHNK